jgi:hypothetical protein
MIDERPLAGIPHVSLPQTRVTWIPDSMTFQTFRGEFMPSIIAHKPAGSDDSEILREVRLSDSRFFAIFGSEELPIGAGVVRCSSNFSVAVVLRLHPTVELQASAMSGLLESVRCASAVKVDRPLAAVRFPAGFGVVADPNLQRFRSLGGEQIEIGFTGGEVVSDAELFRVSGATVLELDLKTRLRDDSVRLLEAGERDDLRPMRLLRTDMQESRRTIYLGSLYCEGDKISFIATIRLPRSDDELAATRLREIGCTDDPGFAPPAFTTVASDACREGDARACEWSEQESTP